MSAQPLYKQQQRYAIRAYYLPLPTEMSTKSINLLADIAYHPAQENNEDSKHSHALNTKIVPNKKETILLRQPLFVLS